MSSAPRSYDAWLNEKASAGEQAGISAAKMKRKAQDHWGLLRRRSSAVHALENIPMKTTTPLRARLEPVFMDKEKGGILVNTIRTSSEIPSPCDTTYVSGVLNPVPRAVSVPRADRFATSDVGRRMKRAASLPFHVMAQKPWDPSKLSQNCHGTINKARRQYPFAGAYKSHLRDPSPVTYNVEDPRDIEFDQGAPCFSFSEDPKRVGDLPKPETPFSWDYQISDHLQHPSAPSVSMTKSRRPPTFVDVAAARGRDSPSAADYNLSEHLKMRAGSAIQVRTLTYLDRLQRTAAAQPGPCDTVPPDTFANGIAGSATFSRTRLPSQREVSMMLSKSSPGPGSYEDQRPSALHSSGVSAFAGATRNNGYFEAARRKGAAVPSAQSYMPSLKSVRPQSKSAVLATSKRQTHTAAVAQRSHSGVGPGSVVGMTRHGERLDVGLGKGRCFSKTPIQLHLRNQQRRGRSLPGPQEYETRPKQSSPSGGAWNRAPRPKSVFSPTVDQINSPGPASSFAATGMTWKSKKISKSPSWGAKKKKANLEPHSQNEAQRWRMRKLRMRRRNSEKVVITLSVKIIPLGKNMHLRVETPCDLPQLMERLHRQFERCRSCLPFSEFQLQTDAFAPVQEDNVTELQNNSTLLLVHSPQVSSE